MELFFIFLCMGLVIMFNVTVPLRYGTKRMADVPWLFDSLRWMLEGGFVAHRRLLRAHFPTSPERVLDLGCGTGIFADSFDNRAYVGIDLSPEYIERARQRCRHHHFEVMDATALHFPAESFEAVIVSGVLHHMENSLAARVLSEIGRVLKPAGKLLMWEDVPTRQSWNIVGQLVHRLDVGQHIRPALEYTQLLGSRFQLVSAQPLLSGCMDYVVLDARRK